MNLCQKMIEMGGKPSGVLGRLIGRLMNLGHKDTFGWGLAHLSMMPDSVVLDVGCGGGAAVKMIAAIAPKGRVCGIDHSPDMVNLSRQVNKQLIEGGRVVVDHGSVSDLPYSDEIFDVVTAFETIEFWPNLSKDLEEVKRVLKPGGQLLVVNRHPDEERGDSKWIEFMQIRTAEEYRERLGDGGYVDISIDDRSRPGWIAVLARRA
jgi:ubiquinone/menaquinone biosynthesis C-methylase UbiE